MFRELGLARKIGIIALGGATLAATSYGLYALYKEATKRQEADEEWEGSAGNSVPEKRILVLGLDGSGKSVFLSALSQGDSSKRPSTTKTEGFNVVCLTTDGLNLNIWESIWRR
ncbi:predicted protein [Nematostella vectensis]|uniref:Uncharacterized protein n=1 Tax=Nematostella vectensis TaxID=45351 RepID=A7RLK5_NEMVE|nr:predicted protein [Nematostella vectensis]|eukprot:XP_001639683.1 predicted protein [Nematostella vectensis]